MLHSENETVRSLLLKGSFGLEKESLRVTEDGFMAHTPHPFPGDEHIVRDFCENQTEINTSVADSIEEVIDMLSGYHRKMQKKLAEMEEPEYLWPFSNPPYIINEEDIPIAQYTGAEASKTEYRNYLSGRYGRYKMTFSGIHFNYSFSEELLKENFKLSGEKDFEHYKNMFYVKLAQKVVAYGWILVAVTAASPLLDGSFLEKKQYDKDIFNGMASVRCGETGYWNFFTPVFDYSSIEAYVDSMQYYVKEDWIKFPSELYFPVRIKPKGENTLDNLKKNGVSHIELRMFDLNPFAECGIDRKDAKFAQLLLVFLACMPERELSESIQVQSVQHYKNAAHYDLKTVNIMLPNGKVYSVAEAAEKIIIRMQEFYKDYPYEIKEILQSQRDKFTDHKNRYSYKVREQFGDTYVKKGLALAKKRAE